MEATGGGGAGPLRVRSALVSVQVVVLLAGAFPLPARSHYTQIPGSWSPRECLQVLCRYQRGLTIRKTRSELHRRQKQLVTQAHRLRKRLGDPVDGLVELLSSLPSEGDTFWLELVEGTL